MKHAVGKTTLMVMLSAWSLTSVAQEAVPAANPYSYLEPAEIVQPRAAGSGDGGGGETAPAINRAVLNDMNVSFEITPETTDLMGESVDLSSGSISFAATDVSTPGNFDIPVEISRRFHDGNFTFRNTAEFGDWGLELPSIHNTLFYSNAKLQGPWGNGTECSASQQQTPPAYNASGSIVQADQYWSGLSLNVGGQTEKLLTSTDGSSVYITKNNWKISCYARTGGEGFKAVSPNGVSYYLDVPHMVRGFMPSYPLAPLYQAYMRVSRIEDRFGNWVNFQYATRVINTNLQSNNLTKITSSDSRTIDLTYAHATQPYLVTSVTANSKTWSYGYDSHNSLQTVTLPDSSAWSYNLWQISHWGPLPEDLDDYACTLSSITTATGSITHPKGASGSFTLKTTLHGHSDTPLNSDNYGGYKEKKCYQTMALTNKTLTGPGVNLSWQYSYSQNKGAYTNETPVDVNVTISNYLSKHLKSTTVVAPDSSKTVHVFSRRWDYLAGQKVATLQYDTDGVTLLQNTTSTFTQQTPVVGGIYLERTNLAPLQYRALSNKSTITQSSDSFITEYFDYNAYGIPKTTKETNSVNTGWLRCTRRAYMHDTTLNVLNLPTTTKVANNTTCATDINDSTYTTTGEVLYYPVSASSGKLLPKATYTFGALQQTYSYHADGSLAQQTDNVANRWVKFSNYKRGKARTIELPGRYNLTPGLFAYRTINDDGTVGSVTDFNGNATSYGYDAVGRVTLVDPANGAWTNTTISYAVPGGGTYALQQTISRGNYNKVVYLDALMRSVLSQEWDAADSSTTRYVNQRFNAYNKAVFSSVPSTSSSETVGSSTTYDGLQRVKQQTNTAEGDVSYRYLTGNKVEKTDGRGFITTTSYLAYGSPEQSQATSIAQPGSITTSLSYNLFDNPTSIVQGGVTENRIYDAQQRLCLQKRPDTGITVYSYNTVGQVTGVAEGLSGAGTSCTGYTNVATAWITTAYDNIGDIYTQSYADGSPAKTYTLDGQGNVKRLSSGTVVWDYEYNSQHLIEKEILTLDNQSFILDPAYNSMGYQTSQTYPSGTVVNYAPNALGQPTQAGSYATNATYHPNGQLKNFTYGNGLTFTQNLDTDYRPYERFVRSGSTLRVGQRYGYDGSENLQSISDLMNSSKSISLGFDGLNRLTSASGYWGSGSLSYDALGNITSKTLGTQALAYTYNSNNLLTSVTGGYSFSYDGRGTVTNNGMRTFNVNSANQMTSSGAISYTYDGHNRRVKKVNGSNIQYSLYNQSGQFLSTTGTNGPTEHIYLGSQLVARISQVVTADDKPGYTGHLEDKDIGLTYMQQRYYDPVIGRFYSNDPVDFMGHMQRGNSAMGFNRYAYANNNPYKYTDPDGEFANFAIGAAIGALTEIGTQFATDGKVSSWTKVGVSAGVGAVSGGLNVVAKGAGVVQAAVNTAMNETVSATAAATGSVIADGLEGNVSGSFERAGVAALESVAGPGKAAVSAVKGKIGGIADAVGMKGPSANTGFKAVDAAVNSVGSALLKTAEGVAGNKINHEIKESNK